MPEDNRYNEKYKNLPPVGTYVRNRNTGDLGQIVEKDGALWIKPDLPGSPVYYPAGQIHLWLVEPRAKKLPPGAWARVAYAADQALCEVHSDFKRQPSWDALHPLKKAEWIERRTKFTHHLRAGLHNLITEYLEKNSE